MNILIAKYRRLPRAGRWGLWALVVVAVSVGLVEPILDRINTVNGKADDRAGALIALAKNPIGEHASEMVSGVRKFGDVLLPGDPDIRSVAFEKRITAVLDKHKIKNNSTTSRTMPLGQGPLRDVYGEGERIDRLVREVQFEGTPEQIAAVVSDLENAPEIAAVSRVQVRRGDQQDTAARMLKVTVAAEAWVVGKKGRAR